MVAKLRKKMDGNYYCSACMMGQPDIEETCFFCGAQFSNWEEIQYQLYKETIEERNYEEGEFLNAER